MADQIEPRLRFDEELHQYVDIDTGEILPSVTQLLERAGKSGSEFYTAEGRERGSQVHRLTLDYDLGAIELADCVSAYKGYLCAWDELTRLVRPDWQRLEEYFIHRVLRFAGTPDRVGLVWKRLTVGEIKTGDYDKSHPLQTALQAILVASTLHIQPEAIQRLGFYIKDDGRGKVVEFKEPGDFREARKILRKHLGIAA